MSVARDEPEPAIALLTIDRPPVNAFDTPMFLSLAQHLREAGAREDLRCVVLTAAGGRAFSAGTDLGEFGDAGSTRRVSEAAVAMFEALAACPHPVIGALNAPAVGLGAMLASQLDVLVAHRGVRFVLPEVAAGFPGGGSHLARLAPWFKLQRMVLLGEPLTAEEAFGFGVLAELLDDAAAVLPAALAIARRIAALSPGAVRPARRILREAGDATALAGYRAELDALAQALGRRP